MQMYTENEIRAVRYYIGDVKNLPQDGFWNDPKAYCLLNALFFPEIKAESARIAEGKRLNPEILKKIPRLKKFFQDFFSVFRKTEAEQNYQTYRVERFSDFVFMRNAGKTISFTSTSTAGFLQAYQDRKGIALLKFQIPKHTPCIDMQKFFQDYAKPEEAEILLPPELKLQFEVLELSEAEKLILDADGKPPVISCLVRVANINAISQEEHAKLTVSSHNFQESGAEAGIRILQALQTGEAPDDREIEIYSVWKKQFISEILHDFL